MAKILYEQVLRDANRGLINAIAAMTPLDADQIENWDIEKIEEKLDIKTVTPKIYFDWERGEKVGWQVSSNKFVSKKDLDRREKMVDSILRKKGY